MMKLYFSRLGQGMQKALSSWLLASLWMTGLFYVPGQAEELTGRLEVLGDKYQVGPGDVLSYQVYHQPEFSQTEILVRADGNASFNSIGELPVAGKTVEAINHQLAAKIQEWVKEPQVTVSVNKTRPGTIYLSGAVLHPGMYQLVTSTANSTQSSQGGVSRLDFRLSNILANSGGVLMDADLSRIEVKRKSSGEVQVVNLWKVLKEGNGDEDAWVQSGDSVTVPSSPNIAYSDEDYNLLLRSSIGPSTFPIRVMGQVTTPGVYELNGTSPYLNSAVAKAGGFKPDANQKVIALRRFTKDNQVSTFYISPQKNDITLRPNDILYVPEKKLYTSGRTLDQVAKVFSPFTSLASSAFSVVFLTGGYRR